METVTNIFGKTIRRRQIDAWVVSLNETEHYFIAEKHKPFIAEIRGVYMFDRNERTCLCELTPSYWLQHVSDTVILTPEADEKLTDEEKSAIYEAYENEGSDDIYVHCHTIDAKIGVHWRKRRFKVYHYGKTGVKYSDSSYDEQIEGIMEYLRGNAVL